MNLEKASIQLSYMLRHSRDPLYVDLDGGWASVDRVLEVLRDRYPQMERSHIEQIVARDRKGRYAFDATGTRIRANQGHSIPVDVELPEVQPPEILFHGTGAKSVPSIDREGLLPMSRLYVHLSTDAATARTVGQRHGTPVIYQVRAGQMARDGIPFYRSVNGVWLVRRVPVQYLKTVVQ